MGDNIDKESLPTWQRYHSGNRRPSGGSLTRFAGSARTGYEVTREEASLRPDHFAMRHSTTVHPQTVVSAAKSPRVLVSGYSSAKLGARVQVGPWRGMPIFLLTLVERETCPSSCHLLRECMGNAMHLSRRHAYDADLVAALSSELAMHQAANPEGFVVRLHALGDFAEPVYVQWWRHWLRTTPALRIFGYTAHLVDSDMGQLLAALNADFPGRCFLRFSVSPEVPLAPMQATTVFGAEPARQPGQIVCPAMREQTACCATCGLCWWPPAANQRIVFRGHGLRKRGGRPRKTQTEGNI